MLVQPLSTHNVFVCVWGARVHNGPWSAAKSSPRSSSLLQRWSDDTKTHSTASSAPAVVVIICQGHTETVAVELRKKSDRGYTCTEQWMQSFYSNEFNASLPSKNLNTIPYDMEREKDIVCLPKIAQPIQFTPSFYSAPENRALLEHFHKSALMVSRGTEGPSPQTETFHRPTGKEENSQEENIKSEIHTEREQARALPKKKKWKTDDLMEKCRSGNITHVLAECLHHDWNRNDAPVGSISELLHPRDPSATLAYGCDIELTGSGKYVLF